MTVGSSRDRVLATAESIKTDRTNLKQSTCQTSRRPSASDGGECYTNQSNDIDRWKPRRKEKYEIGQDTSSSIPFGCQKSRPIMRDGIEANRTQATTAGPEHDISKRNSPQVTVIYDWSIGLSVFASNVEDNYHSRGGSNLRTQLNT